MIVSNGYRKQWGEGSLFGFRLSYVVYGCFVHISDAISEIMNAVHFNIKSCYQFICLSYITLTWHAVWHIDIEKGTDNCDCKHPSEQADAFQDCAHPAPAGPDRQHDLSRNLHRAWRGLGCKIRKDKKRLFRVYMVNNRQH